jgi:hypothetical protein
LIRAGEGNGTSDHLRGVRTAGSMLMTSRRVAFCSRLLGSPPKRTLIVLSGSWKSLLSPSFFFLPFLSRGCGGSRVLLSACLSW